MAVNMSWLWLMIAFYSAQFCFAQTNITTTPAITPTTTIQPIPTEEPTPVPRNTDLAECTCDLTANGCDVNCCCDPECSDEDRLAFSSCVDDFNIVDAYACVRNDTVFIDNSQYLVKTDVPGLFCVQFDNFAERNYYEPPVIVDTTERFDEYLAQYGNVYSFQQAVPTRTINTDYYRSGDPIYTVYETDALGMLGLPDALNTQLCIDGNPAAFLYNQHRECVRQIEELAVDCTTLSALNAWTYYDGFKIFSSPKAFEVLQNNTDNLTVTTISPDVTEAPLLDEGFSPFNMSYAMSIVPVGPHTCIDDGGYNTTCNFGDDLPAPSYDALADRCINTVVKVLYKFVYNGTTGITTASVTFTFRNLTQQLLPLIQNFETQFTKENENDTFRRSGNPGYLPNEPIMAGFLVERTTEDGTVVQAIDLDSNRNNWITMVTSSPNGECASELTNRVPVTFGVNMRSGCFISVYFSNMTESCTQIQQVALNALRGPNPPDYVATFGNTPVESVGDWVQILGINDNPLNPSASQTPGVCRNIITGLHIEFIYANVGSLANPQAKIIGASYQYQVQDEIRYQCVGAYCMPGNEEAPQKIEVTSSIGFIDASNKAVPEAGGKPKVSARLPDDFFYPFT